MAGLLFALLALISAPPLGIAILTTGMPILTLTGSAALAGNLAIAGALGTTGILLSEAAEGMGEGSGGGGGGGSSEGGGAGTRPPFKAAELLEDPTLARGRPPEEVARLLDDELLTPGGPMGNGWVKLPVKKGEGTRWFQAKPATGRSFSIERQPQVDDVTHQGWYLKVARNGKQIRLPLKGNPSLEGG